MTIFFSSRDVEVIQEIPAFDDLDLAGECYDMAIGQAQLDFINKRTFVECHDKVMFYSSLILPGNLGGNMGLYLGCSVMTLVEFLDLFALIVLQWFKKKDHKVSDLTLASNQQATDKPETT